MSKAQHNTAGYQDRLLCCFMGRHVEKIKKSELSSGWYSCQSWYRYQFNNMAKILALVVAVLCLKS